MFPRRLIAIGFIIFALIFSFTPNCIATSVYLEFYVHITDVFDENNPFGVEEEDYYASWAVYDEDYSDHETIDVDGTSVEISRYFLGDGTGGQLNMTVGARTFTEEEEDYYYDYAWNFDENKLEEYSWYPYLYFVDGIFRGINFFIDEEPGFDWGGYSNMVLASQTFDFTGDPGYFTIDSSNGTYGWGNHDDDTPIIQGDFTPPPIPEPATFLLLGAGLLATAGLRRRR